MFKEIAKITLRHHYYRNGYCKGIRLYQDNQTVQLMRRRGCLLRQRSPSEYVILAEEGTSFNPDDQFWFFLEVCDPAFLYNTLKEDWNAASDTEKVNCCMVIVQKVGGLSDDEMSWIDPSDPTIQEAIEQMKTGVQMMYDNGVNMSIGDFTEYMMSMGLM